MPEPIQKQIDIASGRITAGDETLYIQYTLSTTRYVEYLKRIPKLSFNTTFKGLYDSLSQVYMLCSTGNDMIFAIGKCRELALNQLEAIKRFDESEILDVIDFCALFINREGEDISKFDHSIHESKKEALSKEGYEVSGFFQLQVNLIDGFSQAYRKIQELSQGAVIDINLPNTQPIDSTS